MREEEACFMGVMESNEQEGGTPSEDRKELRKVRLRNVKREDSAAKREWRRRGQ